MRFSNERESPKINLKRKLLKSIKMRINYFRTFIGVKKNWDYIIHEEIF